MLLFGYKCNPIYQNYFPTLSPIENSNRSSETSHMVLSVGRLLNFIHQSCCHSPLHLCVYRCTCLSLSLSLPPLIGQPYHVRFPSPMNRTSILTDETAVTSCAAGTFFGVTFPHPTPPRFHGHYHVAVLEYRSTELCN